jgi:phospholipase/carboxylesterase
MLRIVETGAAADQAALAVIMLHGRGRAPEEMAELAAALAVDGVRYFCPEAPGNTWYPQRFFEPFEHNQPALDASLASVAALVSDLNGRGFPDDRVVLCGFSQGGCLAAEMLVRRPSAYAAAILFTGGLIGPPGTIWNAPARLNDLPVLLSGSEIDDWVPAWRTRETGEVLSGLGAKLSATIYPDRPHIVCDDEIVRARAMLEHAVEALAAGAKVSRA